MQKAIFVNKATCLCSVIITSDTAKKTVLRLTGLTGAGGTEELSLSEHASPLVCKTDFLDEAVFSVDQNRYTLQIQDLLIRHK